MNRITNYSIKLVKESSQLYETNNLSNPKAAAEVLQSYLDGADRENFVALSLNHKNRITSINTVSVGDVNSAPVMVANVFKVAILSNASAIIIGHNHPTGDTTLSSEDIMTTQRLIKAGKLLNIPILDHVIVGVDKQDEYFSMKERGTVYF